MPRKHNQKHRRGRNGQQHVAVRNAPTMQGMQQTEGWDLIDMVPIILDLSAGDPTLPAFVQFQAGVNGWNYSVVQNGQPISAESAFYGDITNQFTELQALWSTYRLNSVHLQFRPCQVGAGFQSPIVSAVDPAGANAPLDLTPAEAVVAFSRLRSVRQDSPFQGVQRNLNYSSWITQTCPTSFLQTVDPAQGSGARVTYPEGAVNTAPVTRMSFQVNTSFAGAILGIVHVKANISLRGRRGVQLSAVQLLDEDQQRNCYETLKAKFNVPKDMRPISARQSVRIEGQF